MRLWPLLSALPLACGGPERGLDAPCGGLNVVVLEERALPPARVEARLSLSDCEGEPLAAPLAASAFQLREDGVLLDPAEAERRVEPLARPERLFTALILDLSGSVVEGGAKEAMLAAARDLALPLLPRHQLLWLGFDGRSELLELGGPSTERAALEQALVRAHDTPLVDPSTNLYGAALSALALVDRALEGTPADAVAQGSLVFFTDGQDLAGRAARDTLAEALEHTAHASYAVGVGAAVNEADLTLLGKDGVGPALDTAQVAAAIDALEGRVHARARQDYHLAYCSPARRGQRTLEIRVENERGSGRAHLDFVADGFGAGCTVAGP